MYPVMEIRAAPTLLGGIWHGGFFTTGCRCPGSFTRTRYVYYNRIFKFYTILVSLACPHSRSEKTVIHQAAAASVQSDFYNSD